MSFRTPYGVSFLRKQESRLVPAQAGTQYASPHSGRGRQCQRYPRVRGNWIPPFVGMTHKGLPCTNASVSFRHPMCHFCASRNPEKQLDCRFRGNDIQEGNPGAESRPPSYAGQGGALPAAPSPGFASLSRPLDGQGRSRCFLRLKCSPSGIPLLLLFRKTLRLTSPLPPYFPLFLANRRKNGILIETYPISYPLLIFTDCRDTKLSGFQARWYP